MGGVKTSTGFDFIFYITDYYTPSIVGMGQIVGPVMLIFFHHADFENNYEQSLSLYSFAFRHEFGHNLGLHHTFTCGWYAYTNGVNGDVKMLDNITKAVQGLCNTCLLDGLVMPYSAETGGSCAIMSYRSTEMLSQCQQPENHTVLLDESSWPDEFYIDSHSVRIPAWYGYFNPSSADDCLDEYLPCNYPFNNINYYNFINNNVITETPTYGKVGFRYSLLGEGCPIQFSTYITHEGNNLIEVFSTPENPSSSVLNIFNYEFSQSELEQIFNISDFSKIGVKFEAKVSQPTSYCGNTMILFNFLSTLGFESTLNLKFGDDYYLPKSEYSVVYTDENGTEIDYTYNLPYGRFNENVSLFTSYEKIPIDITNKLRKNYYQ